LANLDAHRIDIHGSGNRIVCIAGDLSEPRLGLDEVTYRGLAQTVDTIYHNGARVDFIAPYRELKGANALGTRNIIELACEHRLKRVVHVSTCAVFGARAFFENVSVLHEDDDIALSEPYCIGGYAQSKWVAETMMWTMAARGLPVTVFRCGFIVGHSQTGICNQKDFTSRMIRACVQLGAYYDLPGKYENFTPVDYVSRAMVEIARRPESAGRAFHLLNPNYLRNSDFWQMIRALGYPLREQSEAQWRSLVLEQAEDSALAPLLTLFFDPLPKHKKSFMQIYQRPCFFSTRHAEELLRSAGITCPPVEQSLPQWVSACVGGRLAPRVT
jgi:thioester reductase-like protein